MLLKENWTLLEKLDWLEQLALGVPFWAERLDHMTSRGPFKSEPFFYLYSYDSVTWKVSNVDVNKFQEERTSIKKLLRGDLPWKVLQLMQFYLDIM